MPTTAQLIAAVNGELDELEGRHGLSGIPIPKSVTTKQLAERVEARLRAIVLSAQEIPRQQLDDAWVDDGPTLGYAMLFVTVTAPSTDFAPPANQNPVWNVVPNPVTFVESTPANYPTSGTYQSNGYVTDPDGDPLAVTKNSVFVQGVNWDGGKFTFDGTGTAQVVGGHILTANDGRGGIVPSSQFTITITAPTFGWSSTPSITYTEGVLYDFDLSPNIIGYSQSTDAITLAPTSPALPSWLSFTGTNNRYMRANGTQVDANDLLTGGTMPILRVTRGAQIADSGSVPVTVNPPTVLSTTFTLTSAVGGTGLPFAFGHAFREGDVPSGTTVLMSGTTAQQCSVVTTWPGGSAKFAVISGKADFTAGVAKVLSLTSGAGSSGTTLTTADLQATGITASFSAGAYGTASFSNADFASPQYSWVSGPVMSSWTFRKVFSGDSDLVAWMEVRLYQGGAVEVLPWVENGFITGSTCANKSATYTFTLGGTQRFSSSIDVKHHTRIPLVTGSTFAYWLGTDPQITPAHNRAYLMSTKLVPNYGWTSPSESTLDGLQQTYTPNTLAGVTTPMSTAGGSAALIPNAQALYVTSNGDLRAYKAVVVHGLSGGSWSTHYRDGSTHRIPLMQDYPAISITFSGTPTLQSGTGGENGTAGTSYTTHQPSFGYLPCLITGWYWFWEESAYWAFLNYAYASETGRRGSDFAGGNLFSTGASGVIDPRSASYANRGAHWSIRTLAQTLALCPSSHPTYSMWVTAWESNAQFYKAVFVDGTFSPGWVSPQGILGDYSVTNNSLYSTTNATGAWQGAGWMNMFGVQAWGFSSDLGLPQSSASLANHTAVRNHAYKQIVQRCGDNTTHNWRRFTRYDYAIGADATGLPPETWYTAAQSYANYLAAYPISAISDSPGLTIKRFSAAGPDQANADLDLSVPIGSYVGPAFSALSYAVEHSAAGASAGWLLITGASNFSVMSELANSPAHGIYPRAIPNNTRPTWRTSMAQWEWKQISGTSLSSVVPSPTPLGSTGPSGRVNAWNSMAAASDGRIWIAAEGGHTDYAGNEVCRIDLSENSPSWSIVSQPTPNAQIVVDSNYYADGKPTSRHGYWSTHFISARDRVFRFGGGGPYINAPGIRVTDGFNVSTNTWDAAGTWANPGTQGSNGYYAGNIAIAKHPVTEDVYICSYGVRKWTQSTATWSQVGTPSPFSSRDYQAAAIDSSRNTMLVVGLVTGSGVNPGFFDIDTGTWSTPSLGDATSVSGLYYGMEYVPGVDRFIVKPNTAGVIYSIHPETFVVSTQTTSGTAPPNAAQGALGRFRYMASLGGIAYYPEYTSGIWFLATE